MSKARHGSPDPREELAELQKKFNLLEGDRKAYFEASQWTIRQNKETVEVIKKENKELRDALAQVQKEKARGASGGSITAEIEKVQNQISTLRRKYNEMKHANNVKAKELQAKQDELHDSEAIVVGVEKDIATENPANRKVRQLENKLEKQNLKCQEGMMFKKTYETILQRLKVEQLELENQIKVAEKDFQLRSEQNGSLEVMMRDAAFEKEKAKSDLDNAKAKLTHEREIRRKELADREKLMEARTKVNEKVEERLRQRQELQMEAAGDLSAEQEAQLKADLTKEQIQQKMSEQKIMEAEEKAEKFEEAFRRIKEATGVEDVNEVIEKFLGQDVQRTNLTEQLRDLQKRAETVGEEKEKARVLLDELKYSGSGNLASRKILDEFDNQVSASNRKVEELRRKHELLSTTVLRAKLGLENLIDKLDVVKVENVAQNDENLADVIAVVDAKLERLAEVVVEEGEEGEQSATAEPTAEVAEVTAETPAKSPNKVKALGPHDVVLSEHNLRIPLDFEVASSEGQQTDRLLVDDDEEEDIPDRNALKERSYMQVHKEDGQGEKKKKKGKRTDGEPPRRKTGGKKSGR
uniref:Uncharacterized protein n=1 Tax=Palpitomonas bilix TaxID=652834 RepID=A0A7S3G820_9EUKA|mmetsp:Transcript_29586/g.76420  ORF Transcript_29586/g.76420 Transcript_29586/m.76420 type:complete len:582 (+) Transcript_29586:256-2001(+)